MLLYKLGLFGMPWERTPFFDNKTAFQRGVNQAVRRTAIELVDTLGRVRGTSGIDPDLQKDVIAQRGLTQLWTELEDQLRASLRIQPMIISNGDESGWLMPAHLATLGFYILRVRSNLVEIRLVLDR